MFLSTHLWLLVVKPSVIIQVPEFSIKGHFVLTTRGSKRILKSELTRPENGQTSYLTAEIKASSGWGQYTLLQKSTRLTTPNHIHQWCCLIRGETDLKHRFSAWCEVTL